MDSIIRKYGNALIEICEENNSTEVVKNQIQEIFKILNKYPNFLDFLDYPNITKINKFNNLKQLLINNLGNINYELEGIFNILIERNRTIILYDILDYFLNRVSNDVIECDVISVIPLEPKYENLLKKVLEKKFNKNIKLNKYINEEIMGGIVIYIDGRLLNLSIKNELDNIALNIRGE